MIVYSRSGGYGTVDLKKLEDIIRALPLDTPGRQELLELKYDYEVLRRIIDGDNCIFQHEDRSETRRLRLW